MSRWGLRSHPAYCGCTQEGKIAAVGVTRWGVGSGKGQRAPSFPMSHADPGDLREPQFSPGCGATNPEDYQEW